MDSSTYRAAFNDAVFLGGAFPRTDTYAALFRSDFSTTEEVSGDGYARVGPLTWGSAFRDTRFNFRSLGTVCQCQEVVFPTQSAAWAPSGTHSITSVRIFDASTGGEQLASHTVAPFSTNAGKQIVVASSRLEFYYTAELGASDFRTKVLEYFLKVSATVPTAPDEFGVVETPADLAGVTALDAGTYTEISDSGYSRMPFASLDLYHPDFGSGPEDYLMIRNETDWFEALDDGVFGTFALFNGSDLLGYDDQASLFSSAVNVPLGGQFVWSGVEDTGASAIFQHA